MMTQEREGYLRVLLYIQGDGKEDFEEKKKNYLVIRDETYTHSFFPRCSLEKIEFMDREGDRSKALPSDIQG